ncbi:hypothetical protein DFH09DRAFT_401820 [Mycena vulgaris]|nr:hypothetical protein DFH09DRAFT_401820 [Mycena vulgaris]
MSIARRAARREDVLDGRAHALPLVLSRSRSLDSAQRQVDLSSPPGSPSAQTIAFSARPRIIGRRAYSSRSSPCLRAVQLGAGIGWMRGVPVRVGAPNCRISPPSTIPCSCARDTSPAVRLPGAFGPPRSPPAPSSPPADLARGRLLLSPSPHRTPLPRQFSRERVRSTDARSRRSCSVLPTLCCSAEGLDGRVSIPAGRGGRQRRRERPRLKARIVWTGAYRRSEASVGPRRSSPVRPPQPLPLPAF